MKRIFALSLVAALLGGCAVVPVGYADGYYGDGWRGHRHYRDDGYRRYDGDSWRDGRRGDWNDGRR